MRKITFVFFLSLLSFSALAQGMLIEGVNYSMDTVLYRMQIGPGVYHSSYRLPAYPLNFEVMEVDLTNPYNQIETVKAGDRAVVTEKPTSMAKRKDAPGHRIVGGTNGDFYFYEDPPEIGIPRSGQFLNGEMIANPTGRASFILGKNKKPYVDRINFRADLINGENKTRLHTVNMLRLEWEASATNFLTLYTDKFGAMTSAIAGGTKVIVRPKTGTNFVIGANDTIDCVVESIVPNTGASAIPAGKAVLHGRDGAATFLQGLTVGAEVKMAFRTQLRTTPNELSEFKEQVGGSDCIVMKNGNAQNESKTAAAGKNPRTGMGFSKDSSTVFMVVVDGRSGVSVGLDLKPFGEVFKAIGAWNAVNLDGGGSSVMYANNQKIVNGLSDGSERAVGNGVMVVSTAPTDSAIGIIKPYKPTISLPRFGEYVPQFYGYNQYGALLDPDLKGVVLSCPSSLGRIEGHKFYASGNTTGNITATYNGTVTTTIPVNFIPVSEIKILLDSVIVDNRSDYPIEVIARTAGGDYLISSSALSWNVANTEICVIENGVVKSLKNGQTTATGQIDQIIDEIQINVRNPAAPIMIGDSLKPASWALNASSQLNAQLNQENLPTSWDHGAGVNFIHALGRAPYIKLSHQSAFYGLPDTIKLVLNTGNIGITKAIISLKSNDTKAATMEFNSFEQNRDFSLDIPVDQLFDINSRIIYPLWFDNVHFYLSASDMTAGKAYTLAVKDILLVYKDYVVSGLSAVTTNSFTIYPNPVQGNDIHIQFKEQVNVIDYELFNLSGQKVMSKQSVSVHANKTSIPAQGLDAGCYFLTIIQNQQRSTFRIIKR